jgi:hypothetical protein
VEPKESNLNQDRNYDWKYEEDSGYSGALEELGLPEKVRMNGGMTYRPHYDFGRIYLTESDKDFITERISATIDGNEYSPEEIDRFAKVFDAGTFNIDTFGKQPNWNEDKDKVTIPKEYESHITTLFDDYGLISDSDFDESGEKISKRAIEYVKFLIDNDLYGFVETLVNMAGQLDLSNYDLFKYKFKDLLYDLMVNYKENGVIDESDNIEYSYTDSR